MRRIVTTLLFLLGLLITVQAQVITTDREFPSPGEPVTITFDATEGNGELEGYTGDVYAHTGVITAESGDEWVNAPEWGDNSDKYKLTQVDTDIYELEISPSIYEYYGISENTTIEQLAFVFRSSDASQQTNDLFVEVYQNEFNVSITSPADDPSFTSQNSTITIEGIASSDTGNEQLTLFINDVEVAQSQSNTISHDYPAQNAGNFEVRLEGTNGTNTDQVTQQLVVNPEITEQARPQGLQDGITYVDGNTVRLSLFAPNKEFVYVIGDFTNWEIDPNYFMNKETVNADSSYFWIELDASDGISAGEEYGFQYFVDGEIRVADPYSEKVLQPDDQYISETTYPNLKSYPGDQTDFSVGVLQPGKTEYQWQHLNYDRPDKEDLVVYELLVRDFVENHDFQTLTDTLDYLDRLGVNAIELMPVMEFEGNISWGYNSAFLFATDKYYGPADDLKRFIDEAHSRGIAVILDIVLNHVYGQSPLVRLWNEGDYGQPTAANPYLNIESPNQTYSWGYDFNHESQATKYYVDRVTRYWLEEFNADGYRFDFTKGFTQNSGDGWARDEDRIRLLKRMADQQWAVDDSSYVILEHLAENSEEQELADYGMLLWGNMHHNYKQSSMGYEEESDFSGIYHKNRNWSKPHLVGYMESHDEQRVMYENLNYGNSTSSGSYDIKELSTALNRIKLSSAFFFTVPGPKMFWQFGELGYEVDINQNGRTGEKPIRWEYYEDEDRKKLYDTYKALIRLRNSHEAFTSTTSDVTMDLDNDTKRITISHPELEVNIAGNFGINDTEMKPQFAQTGDWYDFFSGDTLSVNNADTTLAMSAGEFHIYTTKKFEAPAGDLLRFVPTQINLDISKAFDGASSPQDYRLVALPGQPNITLSNFLDGEASVDWQAYWDSGAEENYMVKYDGSSIFTMNPGNGFWVTSKENLMYDQTVPTVELNDNNQASIPLHDGWNIISNPLHTDVSWSQISAINDGNLQPIWRFDGSYTATTDFVSARTGEAFYFLNDQGLNELLIPYEEASANKKAEITNNEIQLITSINDKQTSLSRLTFIDSETSPADVIAPPSRFEDTSLRFLADKKEQKSSRTNLLAQTYRNKNKQEHQLKVRLSAIPQKPVTIRTEGWEDNNQGIQMALLDTDSGRKYDLSINEEVTIIPDEAITSMLLVIGDTRYINEQQENLLPQKISVNPNYPNPFNQSTTLRFSLPEQTEVRVQIYNVLGQRVSTLINNETRQAGVHTVAFDGSRRASGMYFAVFEIGDQRFIQKMTLIK